MIAVVVAGGLLIAAVLAGVASRWARGYRRLLLQRVSVYTTVPAFTATLVLLPVQFDLEFSDALSMAGLAVSVVFGFGARSLERATSRPRIGLVIPSRVAFHVELRNGFAQSIGGIRADVYDDYLKSNHALENLADFLPSLRRTLAWRPDYLVLASPSGDLLSAEPIADQLLALTKRGGGVVFVDNVPDAALMAKLGDRVGSVTSDVRQGALLIADFLRRSTSKRDKVLVIAGPPTSAPAEIRRSVFQTELPGVEIIVENSGGWTAETAKSAAARHLRNGGHPKFIVAGNDVMAFGVIKALREAKTQGVGVIGYDGIPRALYAIADPDNPFSATVRTPPSAYGNEIAAMILADASTTRRHSGLRENVISMSPGQLIGEHNVELVLDG